MKKTNLYKTDVFLNLTTLNSSPAQKTPDIRAETFHINAVPYKAQQCLRLVLTCAGKFEMRRQPITDHLWTGRISVRLSHHYIIFWVWNLSARTKKELKTPIKTTFYARYQTPDKILKCFTIMPHLLNLWECRWRHALWWCHLTFHLVQAWWWSDRNCPFEIWGGSRCNWSRCTGSSISGSGRGRDCEASWQETL